MKRPLGCISGVGLLAALATLLVVGVVTATAGGGWFSPGALSAAADGETYGGLRSHAEIGGDCTLCHAPPWSRETMADRCTGCHTDLREAGSHLAEFHRLLQGQGARAACRACHPEHRGAEAALTDMSADDFPHDSTGYSLAVHRQTAASQPFTCADCHGASFGAFETATCDACHSELDTAYMAAHRADFGAACLECHDGVDRYAGFDHAGTTFKLDGAHQTVRCSACHAARNPGQFAEAPVECAGCHREDDAHKGEFGEDCGACHRPDDWRNATFDHAKTRFPLTGKHVQVKCADCHEGGEYRGLDTTCAACHAEPAYHRGVFAGGCDACHNTAGWQPARYDEPHIFPIDHGEGGPSTCRTCHPDTLAEYTCYGCHEHTPAGIERKHLEEGVRDFADCMKCHPTGQEEEGEGRGGDD